MKKDIKLLIESIFDGVDVLDSKYDMTDLVVDYVDLGLPSETLWCRCNVGANKETDYGDYYKWGETKNNVIENIASEYVKYNKEDELILLLPEDDIAYQVSNGLYRMPTKEQCTELIKCTDNEWVENYKGSGVNGRIFSSKVNNNYIFIPAVGSCFYDSFKNQGLHGYVWSSNLNTGNSYRAWYMNSYNSGIYGSDFGDRSYGYSVRGVLNKK